MTVIRPNSVSGITSITAQANEINFFRSNGTLAGLQLNGVNFNTTTGISTFAALKVTGNLDVEGVLTYQDVTNVDSIGIITARSGIRVGANGVKRETVHLDAGDSGANYLRFTNTTTGNGTADGFNVGINADEHALLWNFENKDTIFATNNLERLRIFSNGNLGVGDFSSTSLTHAFQALRTSGSTYVSSKNTGGNALFYAEASNGNTAKLELMQAGVGNFTLEVGGGSNALMIKDDGAERLKITSTGNVGIGVEVHDPLTTLHVQDANAGALKDVLTITNESGGANTEVGMVFECGADEVARISAKHEGSDIGPLIFSTATSTNANPTEKLRITSSGQIFIGGNTGYNESAALISIATDASAAANMLSDSSAIYNHNNPAFIHVQNRYNTGDGQEAGIIFHSRSSHNGSWAIFGKRTGSSYLSDLIFRNRTGASSSAERLRIDSSGNTGIGNADPQTKLHVAGSICGGTSNQPFLRFFDSSDRQRNTKHYFKCVKGSTTIFDILTVDINQNFHQALIILYYGARIQNLSDSVTYPVHKIIGVNRFNGGSIQFTKNTIVQNANATNHADIDAVATSSTNYRIRLTYSGTAGGSSFCCGSVEIIGVGSGDDGAFYSLAHSHGLLA